MLQGAAQEHIPVGFALPSANEGLNVAIPDANSRLSMDEVIQHLIGQEWYREQIVFRKTMEARDPLSGRHILLQGSLIAQRKQRKWTPCLLPPLHKLSWVRGASNRFMPIRRQLYVPSLEESM